MRHARDRDERTRGTVQAKPFESCAFGAEQSRDIIVKPQPRRGAYGERAKRSGSTAREFRGEAEDGSRSIYRS